MKRALIAIAGFILLACGSGEIPMPTDPVIDLEARYDGSHPRLDGRSDDAVWAKANPFYVHVEQGSGADRVEFNITFKAVWWKEWAVGNVEWEKTGETFFKLTIPQDFDTVFEFLNNSYTFQKLRCYNSTIRELVKLIHIHNGILLFEYICEAAYRKSPIKRHLPTFKPCS